MEFFSKFPTISTTISNFDIKIVDLLCFYADPIDIFNPVRSKQQNTTDLASISNRIYGDVSNYWSIAIANESINPWTVFPDTVTDTLQSFENNYSLVLYDIYNSITNEAYQTVKNGDIVGYFNPSFTGANEITGINSTGDFGFVTSFNFDTSVMVISSPINLVSPSRFSNTNTGATSFYILEKEDDGSYSLRTNATGTYDFTAVSKMPERFEPVLIIDTNTGQRRSYQYTDPLGNSIKDVIIIDDLPGDTIVYAGGVTYGNYTKEQKVKEEITKKSEMFFLQPTDVAAMYSSFKS